MILLLVTLLSLAAGTLSSYCGDSAVPFTFQSLRSGHPVLGCARPRCFGWNGDGSRAGDTAQFYRINGKEDGYLRRSDQLLRSPNKNIDHIAQTATCAETYRSTGCVQGEWVGGIAPQSDAHRDEIQMRCCTYSPLSDSEDRGVAPIKQSQVFIGGEVEENGHLVAFDYISNIDKVVHSNGTIIYSVSVRRMPCFDGSIEPVLRNDNTGSQVNVPSLDGEAQVRQEAVTRVVPVAPRRQQQGVPNVVPNQIPNQISNQVPSVVPNQVPNNKPNLRPVQTAQAPTSQFGQFTQNQYGIAGQPMGQLNGGLPAFPDLGQAMNDMFQRLAPPGNMNMFNAQLPQPLPTLPQQQNIPVNQIISQERPQPRPMDHRTRPTAPQRVNQQQQVNNQQQQINNQQQQVINQQQQQAYNNQQQQPAPRQQQVPTMSVQVQQGQQLQQQARAPTQVQPQMGTVFQAGQQPAGNMPQQGQQLAGSVLQQGQQTGFLPPQMGQVTPMPTLAPLSLPKLEDLPKIEIPSVEDVENVIPPVQRAILTNIAKFFGVL